MNPQESAPSSHTPSPKPSLGEMASVRRRGHFPPAPGASASQRVHSILRNESFRGFGGASDIHAVYQEMEDKDGHLFAALQTRKLGVLSRSRRVSPPPREAPFSVEALALCERALERLPDFERVLLGVLDSLAKGLAVLEIIWEAAPDGAILPARIVPRWPGRFVLDECGTLRRVDPGDPPEGKPMPARKFIVATFHPSCGSEAGGTGLCLRAYWYSWFKRNNLKSWALFNEKFGAPTVVARYPAGSDQGERDRLLEVVDSIQQDAGVVLPEGVALDLLEAKRGGQVSTYRDLADWCNDEISKIVLGQTLATGEGRRSGSLALGQVHDSVRQEYVDADARMLERVVSDQLLRWVVDFNFGPNVAAPRLSIDTGRGASALEDAELDKLLLGLGVPLDVDYFYEKYGRPRPSAEPGKSGGVLRYDDQNLFQYHLRFGVLTIDEARARLGLPPLPDGQGKKLVNEAGGARNNSADLLGTGEDPGEREGENDEASRASLDR